MSFIAGKYKVTHNAVTIGQLEDGMTFNTPAMYELITGDNLAEGVQDVVYRGHNVTSDLTLLEWDIAGALALYWPWGSAFLQTGPVGRVAAQQSITKSMVLTAVAGPPAETQPATATLPNTILHEGVDVGHVFAPRHRKVPIRLRHFPTFDASFNATWGTLT